MGKEKEIPIGWWVHFEHQVEDWMGQVTGEAPDGRKRVKTTTGIIMLVPKSQLYPVSKAVQEALDAQEFRRR